MAELHPSTSSTKEQDTSGHAPKVAQHYNNLQETGLEERSKSRIFYMRNCNNWIKSQCIGESLRRLSQDGQDPRRLSVLDLGSGKGGDILKWKKGNVSHVAFADIAGTSVEQCKVRYDEMRKRSPRYEKPFTAEFITADCTKVRLKEKYENPNRKFDLVSCQFSFHYSFESYEQADMMIKNACECLRPGGYFIGTTPDSYELMKRLRASDDLKFGNDVYSVTFHSKDPPLFGGKYDFHLEGVVDCPEFLVYFPAFEKIAAKYGMKLVKRIPFAQYFEEQIKDRDARGLIGRMQALEGYPAEEDVEPASSDPNDYLHAKDFYENLQRQNDEPEDPHRRKPKKVGTLSKTEWEALTIYCFFMFQKQMPDAEVPSLKRLHDEDSAEVPSLKRQHDG